MARADGHAAGKRAPACAPRRIAADHLARRGLVIVERNFRTRHGEIDLIARDGDTLVFVEVRLRTRADFGGAAASITRGQARAHGSPRRSRYLRELGREPPCRFDASCSTRLDPARIDVGARRHRSLA